jgi:hypothetical protein
LTWALSPGLGSILGTIGALKSLFSAAKAALANRDIVPAKIILENFIFPL